MRDATIPVDAKVVLAESKAAADEAAAVLIKARESQQQALIKYSQDQAKNETAARAKMTPAARQEYEAKKLEANKNGIGIRFVLFVTFWRLRAVRKGGGGGGILYEYPPIATVSSFT